MEFGHVRDMKLAEL